MRDPFRPRRGSWRTVVCTALLAGLPAALLAGPAAAASVVDDTGKVVALPRAPQRIVSLAPHLTELLYSVGAGAQLVGVTEFSDYPAAAQRLPRVGSSRGLDLERIAALRPELALAWLSGNSIAQIERLERLGIVVFRSEPGDLDAVATSLERLGLLSGHAAQGSQAATALRARITSLRARFAGKTPVRVFYQVWPAPLMTVGGKHLISDVLGVCGAINIFAEQSSASPTVSIEAVLARQPQLIVGTRDGSEGTALRQWQRWTAVPAVRDGHLLIMDAALITRHTERIAEGAGQLCQAIDAVRGPRR